MSRRRGITLVEVLVVVAVVVGIAIVAGCVVGTRARAESRKVKDSTHVRGIHQGFILGAQSGPDSFITPSWYDKQNTTIKADDPTTKNTTANIFSIHVYNGYYNEELLVSPAEVNPRIRVYKNYHQTRPPTAANPDQALWDPALAADFVNGIGGTSYAHMIPGGRDRPLNSRWSNTFQANEAIVSQRGPQVSSVTRSQRQITGTDFDQQSNTLRFFGRSSMWRGNVAYNDNHVSFEDSFMPLSARATDGMYKPKHWDDVLFFDEYLPTDAPDHPYFTNAYLGIFTKAGPTMADYGAIWD